MLTVRFERLGLAPGSRFLDVGCGGGRHTCEGYSLVGVTSVGVDLDEASVAMTQGLLCGMEEAGMGRGSWHVAVANAESLPFPDGHFQAIVCSEVMEHVADPGAAARELARVLAPGGTLAVSVPRFLPEKICWLLSDEYHSNPGGHIRIFHKRSLIPLVAAAGLTPRGHHYSHALHAPYWWLKCLFGVNNPAHPVVNVWHQFLVWDIMKKPRLTRTLDRLLNPVMGKSLVCYFRKT
ncbi:MAG: methyltransferase domain-containing protein [Proteobacteria bacterium]|nr:methyltransferase domain-containing protein [Pseudomonadota bacterium]